MPVPVSPGDGRLWECRQAIVHHRCATVWCCERCWRHGVRAFLHWVHVWCLLRMAIQAREAGRTPGGLSRAGHAVHVPGRRCELAHAVLVLGMSVMQRAQLWSWEEWG